MEEIQESNYPRVFEIEEIITIAWQFYIKHFWSLALISLISIIPNIYVSLNVDFEKIIGKNFDFASGNIPQIDFESIKLIIISSVFVYLSFIIKSLFIKDQFYSEITLPFDLLIKSLKIFIPFIICLVIYIFGLVFSTLMFIIPGIVFGIFFTFSPFAILLKNQNIFNSFVYSYKIVSGRFIKSSYYILVLMLIYFAIELPISFLPIFFKSNYSLALVTVFSSLVVSFTHITFVVLFINFDDTKHLI